MDHGTAGASRAHTLPDLGLGLATWGAFILATCAYCLVHQAFVSAVTPDITRTVTIALREWGAWALLAPWALRAFRETATPPQRVLRCLVLGLIAASLPVIIDQLMGERAPGSSLALFWPRNVAMAVALLIIARAFAKPAVKGLPDSAPLALPVEAPQAAKPATLMVSKGADQCVIRIDDIQHLSAAGNYVDIRAGGQNYLMRATMAELAELLPAGAFVRVHRRHIVRVCEIERIRVERSGSGTVHLRGGGTLAISKSYRAQLKARQEALKTRVH